MEKIFYGISNEVFKNYLQKLSSVAFEEEINDKDSYLCSTCERELKTAVKLQQKLYILHTK